MTRMNNKPEQSQCQNRLFLDLIKQTRLALSPAKARRLKRLMGNSERGTLTEEELAEYGVLARRAEEVDAQRAEALAALVRRRGVPVEVVKQEIG